MNKVAIFSFIYLAGVVVSSFSQIMLKKNTRNKKEHWWQEYLNASVFIAYTIFFIASLCSVFAYKYIPLSFGPILGSTEYVFVAVLSYIFLKEKIGKKKLLGLVVIVVGVLIYSI